jgi:penicillin-binding protein 1A
MGARSKDSPSAAKSDEQLERELEKSGGERSGRASGGLKRWIVVGLALGLFACLSGVGAIGGVLWYYGRDLDAIDEDALRNYQPPVVTRILSSDGTLIGELYTERRTTVPFDRVPTHVEGAFLAAEDADFHRHRGMDFMGMVRALITNVRAGRVKQGASTITQQVVKNFLLSPERSMARKVQELILARRLEELLSKQEILELYLNSIYLGHGRYGIEEASQFYFGKSIADIDLGQAALLATLPKAPSRDSPFKVPEKAKARQVFVLEQMVDKGFARAEDAQVFIDAEISVQARELAGRVTPGAEEFVDAARAELVEIYGQGAIATLGATVTTSVDLDLQRAARKSLREGLVSLDVRHRYGHGIKPAKKRNLERARKKGGDTQKVGDTYPIVIEACPSGGAAFTELARWGFCGRVGSMPYFVDVPEGSRYDDPKLEHSAQFQPGGITMVSVRALAGADEDMPAGFGRGEIGSGPEAAVVLAEVESGKVLAMVGGADYRLGAFNRALRAKRQPGSSFKPFVYGAALASKRFTAATLVSDSPEIYEKWRPTNFERDVYRGDIRLRSALTHSVNTIAIKLLDTVGFTAVHDFARTAGIETPLAKNLSIALGTSEVTPFELLRGYLTIARVGSRIEPRIITKIERPGEGTVEASLEVSVGMAPAVAHVLTSMMTSVVQEGTARRARALGRPAAGKTGTSGDNKDAWFAGFTPGHVAVAWVGFDTPKKIGRGETGGRAALPIWLELMKAASGERPVREFEPPPEVSVRRIDKATGLLAPAVVPQPDGSMAPPPPESVMDEVFIVGTEPVEVAEAAAVADPDLLLGLYDDEPEGASDGAETAPEGVGESSPETGGGSGVDRAPGPERDAQGLPSLDDEL